MPPPSQNTTLPVTSPGSPAGGDQASTSSSTPLTHPDSTHQPYTAPFTEGEDILVHDQDGLIYFGVVVEVDHDGGQCLVRFGDATEKWANFYELRRLEEPEELEPSHSAEERETKVTVIEQFHRELTKQLIDPWREASEEVAEEELKIPDHVVKARSQLSYNWDGLEWDEAHQVNKTDTYCYCGEKGDWYKRMLQCQDCLQWFHQECIRSLSYQLMFGDRFFRFTCTLCNGKQEETIQRLELGVVDALHLVILNLILSKNQKFHDLESSIIPFIKKKLKYLTDNGSNSHFKLSMIQADNIIKVLSNNKSRFKNGSEGGQQSCFWGLRRMVAPWLPSKYLVYRPKHCRVSSSIKRLKETLIQPNNKKGIFQRRNKPGIKDIVSKNSSLKRPRPKDSDFSDSESSFGTLDLLIKPPKDFSGLNNPFRLSSDKRPGTLTPSSETRDGTPESVVRTPDSRTSLLLGDKESPCSGTPSHNAGEECRKELLESVAEILKEETKEEEEASNEDEESDERGVFKIPHVITSYFAPTAKTRIVGGNAFQVKAKRLTLNGDIAYLINWEPNTLFDS